MPYRIIGKAAPFDVMNSFREILLPGSLDEFLATPKAKELPMRHGHERQVGIWHQLHIAGGWLHCQGTLDDRDAERDVRNGMNDLSIGYCNTDVSAALKTAKSDNERYEAMGTSRIGRGIDYIAKMMHDLPPDVVMCKLQELDEMSWEDRKIIAMEACMRHSAVEKVARAELHEISIVDSGSFKGTSLHWEKI